jgi:hypothetical protein
MEGEDAKRWTLTRAPVAMTSLPYVMVSPLASVRDLAERSAAVTFEPVR